MGVVDSLINWRYLLRPIHVIHYTLTRQRSVTIPLSSNNKKGFIESKRGSGSHSRKWWNKRNKTNFIKIVLLGDRVCQLILIKKKDGHRVIIYYSNPQRLHFRQSIYISYFTSNKSIINLTGHPCISPMRNDMVRKRRTRSPKLDKNVKCLRAI